MLSCLYELFVDKGYSVRFHFSGSSNTLELAGTIRERLYQSVQPASDSDEIDRLREAKDRGVASTEDKMQLEKSVHLMRFQHECRSTYDLYDTMQTLNRWWPKVKNAASVLRQSDDQAVQYDLRGVDRHSSTPINLSVLNPVFATRATVQEICSILGFANCLDTTATVCSDTLLGVECLQRLYELTNEARTLMGVCDRSVVEEKTLKGITGRLKSVFTAYCGATFKVRSQKRIKRGDSRVRVVWYGLEFKTILSRKRHKTSKTILDIAEDSSLFQSCDSGDESDGDDDLDVLREEDVREYLGADQIIMRSVQVV